MKWKVNFTNWKAMPYLYNMHNAMMREECFDGKLFLFDWVWNKYSSIDAIYIAF